MAKPTLKPKGMDAKALGELLAPFKLLCTKHALSARYKTLELTGKVVRGLSSFAALEVAVNLDISEPCAVDAALFLSVLDSLPKGPSLRLIAGDGVLAWECGNAKGKFAMATLDKPLMEVGTFKNDEAWEITDDFSTALTLGSLSCIGNNTLASVGMYGVVLDNRKGFSVSSSDNVTLSYYAITKKSIEAPELMTLPPDGAKVLAMLADRAPSGEAFIMWGDGRITFKAPGALFLLRVVPSLKADLATIIKDFKTKEHKAEIPPDAISAFIKRVNIISETKKNSHVTMSVAEGTIGLTFNEAIASSEESYLVEGLDDCPDVAGIDLSAEKLARALAHVDSVVLDNASRNIIMFTGSHGDFKYLVCGRTIDA